MCSLRQQNLHTRIVLQIFVSRWDVFRVSSSNMHQYIKHNQQEIIKLQMTDSLHILSLVHKHGKNRASLI